MDLSEILAGQNARVQVLEADAQRVLLEHATEAMKNLDSAKRQVGNRLPVRAMGVFVGEEAAVRYDKGKLETTRLLFDGYSEIVFAAVQDAEILKGLFDAIKELVEVKLSPAFDVYEAERCRLTWVKKAWAREEGRNQQPTPDARDQALREVHPLRQAWDALRSVISRNRSLGSPGGQVGVAPTTKQPDVAQPRTAPVDAEGQVSADTPANPGASAQSKPSEWEDVELVFVGDHDVEIRTEGDVRTLNYKQIDGFEDRRTGKPSQLWAMLRVFGRFPDGTLPDAARDGAEWTAIRKKIERTSKVLKKHFGLTSDPFPYVPGNGYRARLKITLPSSDPL